MRGCGGLLRVACGAIEADAERLTAASRSDVGGFSPRAASGAGPGAEDRRAERRRLAAVWLSAGSAVAAAVGSGWVLVLRNGGRPPGGDMVGHAAAAEWLRTLPWWDWRGWSDWFNGGQAIGVNHPPLGHAWMRFTDPVHGQMAAVAIGPAGGPAVGRPAAGTGRRLQPPSAAGLGGRGAGARRFVRLHASGALGPPPGRDVLRIMARDGRRRRRPTRPRRPPPVGARSPRG